MDVVSVRFFYNIDFAALTAGIFSRPLQTISSLLKPSEHGEDELRNRMKEAKFFNKKHGAVKRCYQQGDAVYVKVYRRNSWQWEAATVIEKIGNGYYNVFLKEKQQLVRSHTNQLKSRMANGQNIAEFLTPLSVVLDNFGLKTPLPSDQQSTSSQFVSCDEPVTK